MMYADYRAKSFWLEQASADDFEHPAVEGMLRADVLVVGGGLAGISAAYHLKKAEPGMRVVLLESDEVGYGATGRSAGLVTASFGTSLAATVARFGRHKALEARRYMERAIGCLGDLVQSNRIACDYDAGSGFIRVAAAPAGVRHLRRELQLAESMGIDNWRWLDAPEVRAQINSPTYLAALADPAGGLVNPAQLVRGLKRAAVRNGVEIYERSPVTQIDFEPRARAQTPRGSVEAEKLVLATSAYTAQFPQLRSRQFPIHTYVVLTEPLSRDQVDGLRWRRPVGVEDARVLAHYYRLTPDRRLLMGGGDWYYFPDSLTGIDRHVQAFAALEQFVGRTFPLLRGVRFTHRWGGPVSATADFAPVIGRAGRRRQVIYSAGSGWHGLALSALNGRTLSDLALDRRTDLTDVFFARRATIPLPPEPLRWPLVKSMIGLARVRDRLRERNRPGE